MSNEVEDIITDRIITPDGLAIDWIYDLLYWTDTGLNHIQVSRLDGKDRKTIIKDSSLDQPRAIAIDPNSGFVLCLYKGFESFSLNKIKNRFTTGSSNTHEGRISTVIQLNRLFFYSIFPFCVTDKHVK